MSRVLLAFVFVAALSATTLAANVHFGIAGVDTTALSLPSGVAVNTTIELHCNTEDGLTNGMVLFGGMVDCYGSSAGVLPQSAVVYAPAWAGMSMFDGAALHSLFAMMGDGPGDCLIATLDVPTAGLADGVYTVSAAGGTMPTVMTDAVGAAVPTTTTDLVITVGVVPEPATLGLLVLGGLAVLRRRFA